MKTNKWIHVLLLVITVLCGVFCAISFFELLNNMVTYKYHILHNYPRTDCVDINILEQQLKTTMIFDAVTIVFFCILILVNVILLISFSDHKKKS